MKAYLFFLICTFSVWAKPSSRIIGGTSAYAGEFLFAAAIYKTTPDGNFFCGGTLLNQLWVLTAGQCVDGAIKFTIILGTTHLKDNGTNVVRLATEAYVLHPEYDPLTLANDIGLIKFRDRVEYTSYIYPAGLPYQETIPVFSVTVGWGQTSDSQSNISDELKYVILYSVSDDECRKTYGSQLLQNMFCFEGSYNEGTCYGDSGSPLIQRMGMGYDIVMGVASFFSANGCESTDPSGFIKVWAYNNWISNLINEED